MKCRKAAWCCLLVSGCLLLSACSGELPLNRRMIVQNAGVDVDEGNYTLSVNAFIANRAAAGEKESGSDAFFSRNGSSVTNAMIDHPESEMWKIVEGDINQVNGRTAFDAMRRGDAVAKAVCDKYIEYIACGAANVINIFQPEVLVFGGGISKEGETLLAPMRPLVQEYDYARFGGKQTKIVAAKLGRDAGIIGAAFLGRSMQ